MRPVVSQRLLRDDLDDFGRSLFDAADAERPSSGATEALLSAVVGATVLPSTTLASAPTAAMFKGAVGAAVWNAAAGSAIATTSATTSAGSATATTSGLVGSKLALAALFGVATAVSVAAVAVPRLGGGSQRPVVTVSSPPPQASPLSNDERGHDDTAPSQALTITPSSLEPMSTAVWALPEAGERNSRRTPASPEPRRNAREERSEPPVRAATEPTESAASASEESERPSTLAEPALPPSQPTTAKDASLHSQIALVDAARRGLRGGDARGALATIAVFEQRYGSTAVLAPEAKLVRVQAHLALGEVRLAESAAAALSRAHPSSGAARRAAALVRSSN
jgi:hypothetical protein